MDAGAFELADPVWFLDRLDGPSGRAGFVRADRQILSGQPFLDGRWPREGLAASSLPFAELPQPAQPPRLGFIWHTSFCASTLLATCLDAPGRCLALKEPRALRDLAGLRRRGLNAGPALARAVFGLIARRPEPHEQVLVKPSNLANSLIGEAAEATEGRALLLYGDCESFLISMARLGVGGFTYVRELFAALAADGHPLGKSPPGQLFQLTDLQLAALVWRMQMDVLEAASARLGVRARSLDAGRFLAEPGPTLAAIDRFFGLGLGPAHIDQLLAGPLLRRDAKVPGEPFDPAARADQNRRLRDRLGPDLDIVLASTTQAFPYPPRLAPPLELDAAPAERAPVP